MPQPYTTLSGVSASASVSVSASSSASCAAAAWPTPSETSPSARRPAWPAARPRRGGRRATASHRATATRRNRNAQPQPHRNHVPDWMLRTPNQRRHTQAERELAKKMRPDLFIPSLPRAATVGPHYTGPTREERMRHTVYIVEFGCCGDLNHPEKVAEKTQQHEKLAARQRGRLARRLLPAHHHHPRLCGIHPKEDQRPPAHAWVQGRPGRHVHVTPPQSRDQIRGCHPTQTPLAREQHAAEQCRRTYPLPRRRRGVRLRGRVRVYLCLPRWLLLARAPLTHAWRRA
jgi:hypothetical protein